MTPSSICSQEPRLEVIEKTVQALDETVNGNGRDGLVQMSIEMRSDIKHIKGKMDDIKTNLGALMVFRTEVETEKAYKDKVRKINQWRIGTIIASLIGLAGILLAILI